MRSLCTGLLIIVPALSGCGLSPAEQAGAGVLGATLLAARTPSNEIEQIYYLGVFDPQEQLPEAVYRIRVHGQASAMSSTKFASGWVPAGLIDSLGSSLQHDDDGLVSVSGAEDDSVAALQTGRRLMIFGPEGMREAPRDHRLVLVMGASPEEFFQAIDETLGAVSGAVAEQRNAGLQAQIVASLAQTTAERERLQELMKDIVADFPSEGGAR